LDLKANLFRTQTAEADHGRGENCGHFANWHYFPKTEQMKAPVLMQLPTAGSLPTARWPS
jgi:hypothetical protein